MKLFARPMKAPHEASQRWHDLSGTLVLAGFEPSDFEVRDDMPEGWARRQGLSDQLITLRRRSTGHKQLYSVAPGCPWLFSAFADLTAGRFGEPDHERADRVLS